ncbi:hypothetical protein ACFOHY_17345 [Rhizobium rosettiformans]|uniref:hypothetical protein n=1 Tax=Rhizobium rosettiformans TaxID=1368430 RepID=UPI0036242033
MEFVFLTLMQDILTSVNRFCKKILEWLISALTCAIISDRWAARGRCGEREKSPPQAVNRGGLENQGNTEPLAYYSEMLARHLKDRALENLKTVGLGRFSDQGRGHPGQGNWSGFIEVPEN